MAGGGGGFKRVVNFSGHRGGGAEDTDQAGGWESGEGLGIALNSGGNMLLRSFSKRGWVKHRESEGLFARGTRVEGGRSGEVS